MSCRRLDDTELAVLARILRYRTLPASSVTPELFSVLEGLVADGFVFLRGGSYQLSGSGAAHLPDATRRGVLPPPPS